MRAGIIGGGICGLYIGQKLAQAGHKITIFERKPRIGNETCSGLFSERILDFIPESKALIQNKIKIAVLHFPKKDISILFSKEFLVMSHFKLDTLAAEKAKEAGVEIILNRSIFEIPAGFDGIIGCDGAMSYTRKFLKLRRPRFKMGMLGFVAEKNSDNFVEVWPQKNGGFIWKIPRGNETEYGIMADPLSARQTFQNFLKSKKIYISRKSAKIIPQGFILPRSGNITLCGDSSGLTKPWSGGGVIWGLKCADMLVKTFPDFSRYRKQAINFFRFKILLSKIAVKLAYFIGFNFPFVMPKRVKIESDFLV